MSKGFSLVELVMVVLLMGIIAAVSIPNFLDLRDDAREAVTRDEMAALKRAIVGDGKIVAGGRQVFPGYESDMGGLPTALVDLVTKPGGASDYDPITRRGWRGPYVDDDSTSDYESDAWGNNYVFSVSPRRIRSMGPNGVDDGGASDDIDLTY